MRIESDSDHGGAVDSKGKRRSVTGHLMHHHGNLMSWCSRTQRTPALSVCEAELMALVDASKEGMGMRNLMQELGMQTKSITCCTDSIGTRDMCTNPAHRGRVKHMDLRWHWLRFKVTEGRATVAHISGETNAADALTKPLSGPRFSKLVSKFMHDTQRRTTSTC